MKLRNAFSSFPHLCNANKSFDSRHLMILAMSLAVGLATGLFVSPPCHADEPAPTAVEKYEREIKPILVKHCYDCHGYGSSEGNFTLDQFKSAEDGLSQPEHWWRVVKNIRAGVMPPAEASELSDEELQQIFEWVKFGPFKIDPENLDPGPVTVRRLNRVEYGNTIRELMGVPFDEKLLFPPDDSGHGFDNVADAMMVSPLLLEKYLQAAELVVEKAVPKVTWIVPRQDFAGEDFKSTDPSNTEQTGRRLNGKQPAEVESSLLIDEPGEYLVSIDVKQHGSFEFDPARYEVTCRIDDHERFSVELGWDENKRTTFEYKEAWQAGEHKIHFNLEPVVPVSEDGEALPEENSGTSVSFQIEKVSIEGPLGTERRVNPPNYKRFFTRESPPSDPREKFAYAAECLQQFATRAFRREVDDATVAQLAEIAQAAYLQPDVTFEAGVGRAIVATLVSPKFLFRVESTIERAAEGAAEGAAKQPDFAAVDEHSLASRLSYFLWSSMPDEELLDLARAGKLRENLATQVDRMLADPKAEAFVSNFVGQWLRTRDVLNIAIDPAVVLGVSEELEELRAWVGGRFRRGRGRVEMSEDEKAKFARYREIRALLERVDDDLKRSMRRETEMLVEHIVRSDANLLDVLDCDYTFVNEKLAEHYGIEGVKGREMRLVKLPSNSPRGGVLTHASILLVTSNPTRTSPVKRGLFVLDNILGTPAPPAPAAVPELEASANRFEGREPTLRELLEVHRESDLCASCHARMDPLGFALENFDALGMWREQDGAAIIEPQGQLVTGEKFANITSLKKLLRENHAQDFYRCITEKLLIFAIGRGTEYSDEHTIDLIVQQLQDNDGRFRPLVHAIVASAPFQKLRISAGTERTASLGSVDH